jgi:hypothetical protein
VERGHTQYFSPMQGGVSASAAVTAVPDDEQSRRSRVLLVDESGGVLCRRAPLRRSPALHAEALAKLAELRLA